MPPLVLPPLKQGGTRLILVRHGRTPSNRMGVVRGRRVDDSLDAVGRIQAARLGDYLSGTAVDAVFASTLTRAQQTAQAVIDARQPEGPIGDGDARPTSLSVRCIHSLDEVDFGSLEGRRDWRTKAEVAAVNAAWAGGLTGTCYRGGGESRADLWERGTEALATLLDSAPSTGGGVVVAVSHGDILAEALIPIALRGAAGAGVVGTEALATGLLTPKAADLRNTCVNVIDVCRTGAGGSRAVRINDVSHLTPTGSPLRRRFDLREPAAAKVQR